MANYVSKHTGAQIDAAVDNVGLLDGKVTTLSEEMAKQATPESFGAKGDGVTDDAAAIAQALASSRNVVFDGTKTYAVGSTITIPADSFVDFRGATIVPMGNHDVIRVMPGSFIENLIVRCGSVAGWDSAAIVLYGGDHFRATNPTKICNAKLYNNTSSTAGTTTLGIGIKLYGDTFGDFLEGVTVEDSMTYGFGNGMLFEGLPDDAENPTGSLIFIGANKFRGYWSFYDNVGISMTGGYHNTHITNNIFTDLQIEPKNVPQKDKQSSYGIYCEDAFTNYFEGCLYDYFNDHTAIYFGDGANRNVVRTTDSQVYAAAFCVDYGRNNIVVNASQENIARLPYTSTEPNVLAFIDKRADCTLESFDGEPTYGNLSDVFDPTPGKVLHYEAVNSDVSDRRSRITINCRTALRRVACFALQFNIAPKSIKVTFYNDKDAVVVYDTKNNGKRQIVIPSWEGYGEDKVYGVAKIVIEIGGFNNAVVSADGKTSGSWELARIMALDSYGTGNAWLRRDGGEVYGDIRFQQGKGVALTAENGKKYLLVVSNDGTLSTSEYIEPEEEAPDVATLTPIMKAGATWYDVGLAGAAQNTITSIAFNAAYEPTGNEDASWPCDEDLNGNIMAYRNGTEVIIKSNTGSEGVKLNVDSTCMFANDGTNASFANLANISGTETLRADKNTNASKICQKNEKLANPIHIPEGVVDMGYAFAGCYKLAAPPVLPNGLTNLTSAFGDCVGMKSLPEIPDTVTNLNYAFQNCRVATTGPSKVPAAVTSMTNAFRLCAMMGGTLEINAQTLTAYGSAFDQTCRDIEGGLVLTGTSPYLDELAATNTLGKVTVAS